MDIADLIEAKRQSRLDAYRVARSDIREHAGIEETVLAGGYGYRQVLELVQNGADAILEESEQTPDAQGRARIEVILHEHHLYVANTGAPLSEEGVEALLQSHSSPKRGNQIGRFGLGFKSLLRLGGQLDILSTSGSLRFDPKRCQSEIRREFKLPEMETSDNSDANLMAPIPCFAMAKRNLPAGDWSGTKSKSPTKQQEATPHTCMIARPYALTASIKTVGSRNPSCPLASRSPSPSP